MTSVIGETAGMVWRYLKENGPATTARIQKGIGADAALTNQALGWLAREGKVAAERQKRTTTFTLIE